MTSIESKIQAASAHNNELLYGLHETDSAPAQLKQQTEYLTDLVAHISRTRAALSKLEKQTKSELEDHKKYSESTFRRYAHKASGRKERFAEKAAKEEREYFDAIQAQKKSEDELAYLVQQHDAAERVKTQYAERAQRHGRLQAELDALYDSIFGGPTPEFPFEDGAEQACNAANGTVQSVNQGLERERHVAHLLRQIVAKLTEARRNLDSAHGASQMDLFGGGTMSSMMKRNDLERAASCVHMVQMLQAQLQPLNASAANLGLIDIDSGDIWGDVIFDNFFTDMQMHEKIKKSEAQVDAAGNKCGQHLYQAEGRIAGLERELEHAENVLKGARVELQKAREEAFRRVLGGQSHHVGSDAPPPYDPPAYSA